MAKWISKVTSKHSWVQPQRRHIPYVMLTKILTPYQVKYIVLLYFFPNNKRLRTNERYQFSIRTLRNATGGLVDGAVASSIWQERFRRAVDTRPDLYMEKIHRIEGCEGCNKHDRTASWRAHLTVRVQLTFPSVPIDSMTDCNAVAGQEIRSSDIRGRRRKRETGADFRPWQILRR